MGTRRWTWAISWFSGKPSGNHATERANDSIDGLQRKATAIGQLEKTGKGCRNMPTVVDPHRTGCHQPSHGKAHGNAVVEMAFDSAGTDPASADDRAIRGFLDGDAEGAQD